MSSVLASRASPSNVSVTFQEIKPVSSLPSLVRYELLVLVVWFCLKMGRSMARPKRNEDEEENELVERARKRFDKMGMYALIAALLAVAVWWLIVDVFFYSTFHAAVQTTSTIGAPVIAAYTQAPPPSQYTTRSRAF